MDSRIATPSRPRTSPRAAAPSDHPSFKSRRAEPPSSAPAPPPGDAPTLARLRDAALAEVIVHRADLLLPADRALLRAHFGAGITTPHLARLAPTLTPGPGPEPAPAPQRTQSTSRLIRKRIRALADRVLSREFAFVMAHQREWPPARRRAAQALVLHGLTLRDAAARTGLPVHALRRHADEIRALCEEAHRAETTGGSR